MEKNALSQDIWRILNIYWFGGLTHGVGGAPFWDLDDSNSPEKVEKVNEG